MKFIRNLIIIILILGAVFIGVGFASGASWDNLFDVVTLTDDYVEQDPIVYAETIHTLDVDVETRHVKISSTDEDEITINHYRIETEIWEISLTDGVLAISEQDMPGIGGWFNWRIPFGNRDDILISIPETYAFEIDVITNTGGISLNGFDMLTTVSLETDTGSIDVENISATDLNVSSDTGSLNMEDVSVDQDVILETNTGSMNMTNVSSVTLDVMINTGSIGISGLTADQIDLMTDTGSINVSGVELNNRTLHLQTDTGSIHVRGQNQGNTYNYEGSDSTFYIDADTDTGSISIND